MLQKNATNIYSIAVAVVVLLCWFMILSSAATPARAQDITTGLAGHWKLDETSGTTVFDSSGNGNNASMQGGLDAANDSVPGRLGRALELEATSNECIHSPFLNVSADATFTFSAWFKSSSSQVSFIVSEANTGNGIPSTALADNNGVARAVWRDDGNILKVIDGTTSIEDGEWHHLAAVADGSTLRLYVDGKEEGTGVSISGTISLDNTSIGCFRMPSNSNFVDGTIDDVRIYDRDLSAEEVSALYAAWPGHLRYSTNHRVPEYYNESEWITAAPGPYVPHAVAFDGTNDYLLRGSALTGASNTTQVTGSVWFKTGKTGAIQTVYSSNNNKFFIGIDSTNVFGLQAKRPISTVIFQAGTTNTFTDNTWHHALFSVNTTDTVNTLEIYVDGILQNNNFLTSSNGTIDVNQADHGIGILPGGLSSLFEGDLAEFWLDFGTYIDLSDPANRRKFIDADGMPADLGPNGSGPTGSPPDIFLSGDTADWHTNKGTGGGFTENGALTDATTTPGGPYAHVPMDGLVGWWRLDETSGSDVIDYVSANDGTYMDNSGSAANVAGQGGVFGGALPFISHKVSFGANADFDFSGTNAFTFSAWVKPQESGIRILHRGFGLGSNASYTFGRYHLDPTSWELQIRDGSSFLLARAPSGSVDMNVWSHITGTWNGSDLLLYENASVVASANDATFMLWDPPTTAYQETSIGGDGRKNESYFGGLIDDVMVWNRALSASEVGALYDAGVCADPVRTNGTIVYNGDFNLLQYCDGVSSGDGWRAMGPPGAGGAGCSDPSGARGSAVYHGDYHVLQYCDGSTWRALGKIGDPCDGSPSPGQVCADGSVYAGLSPDGNVPMYTTPADAGQYAWNNGVSSWVATGQTDAVTGENNTGNLTGIDSDTGTAGGQPHKAAQACADLIAHGHDDWYLPAKDELNILYVNHAAIGGFDTSGSSPDGHYWPSSEYSGAFAWGQRFSDGYQRDFDKTTGFSVRCVRK